MFLFHVPSMLGKTAPEGALPDDRSAFTTTMKIAWPSMVEYFLIQLVGIIDSIMVGRLGAEAIAAVGLTSNPKLLGMAVFYSLCTALSAVVARRRGENDRDSANRALFQSLAVSLVLTVIISISFVVYSKELITFVGGKEDTIPMASNYLRIVMGGMIFQVITMVINAAQRGAGRTKVAMWTNIVSNSVNVVFNYLLIYGKLGFPRLGVQGAAVATVLGTIAACVMSIISVMSYDGFISMMSARYFRFDKKNLRALADVGSSAFVERIFMRIGFLTFSMMIANLGTKSFAAHQVGMNMLHISLAFGDGLSVASIALVGRSLGEKRRDLAKMYGNLCLRIGYVLAAGVAVIYLLWGKEFFMLFTDDPTLLSYSKMLVGMCIIVIAGQIGQVILFGSLRGSGDTKYTAIMSLVSVTIFRPICSWIFCYPLGLGLFGAWIGMAIDQILRFVLAWHRFSKGKWMNKKL